MSVLGEGEEGAGGGIVSVILREEVGGLEGPVGDWQPDLVNKSAEINSLDFYM